MEINIENEKYMCAVIGKPIYVPQLSDFGITQNDIDTYDEYIMKLNEYTKKIKSTKKILMYSIGGIILMIEIICLCIKLYPIYNDHIIYFSLNFFLLYICLFASISYIQFAIIRKKLMPKEWINKFIKHFHKEPKPNATYTKVYEYKEAYISFQNATYNLRSKYPYIEFYRYNFDAYCSAIIIELVKQIQRFTSVQNGIIIKDNLRQEQNYWFNLDPYEFEEEVAHWFSQQGYQAIVTKKSGDEGIDVIIKKGNYIGYVQCKRYTTSKVDRPTLNALFGVVSAYKATQGIIVCLQGVTSEAKEFAKRTNIRIITIEELAPEESLFYHKIHKDTIYENPTKVNLYWCKVGNITLNTRCYIENSSAISTIKEWNDIDNNHVLQYKNIYFILHCTNENFCEFTKYLGSLKKETNKTKQNHNYKKNR